MRTWVRRCGEGEGEAGPELISGRLARNLTDSGARAPAPSQHKERVAPSLVIEPPDPAEFSCDSRFHFWHVVPTPALDGGSSEPHTCATLVISTRWLRGARGSCDSSGRLCTSSTSQDQKLSLALGPPPLTPPVGRLSRARLRRGARKLRPSPGRNQTITFAPQQMCSTKRGQTCPRESGRVRVLEMSIRRNLQKLIPKTEFPRRWSQRVPQLALRLDAPCRLDQWLTKSAHRDPTTEEVET